MHQLSKGIIGLKAPIPRNEAEWLAALRCYEILDTLPEQIFDDLTLLAAQVCGAPHALYDCEKGAASGYCRF